MKLVLKAIFNTIRGFIFPITVRSLINTVIIVVLAVAVVKQCNKACLYENTISELKAAQDKNKLETTPAIKQAEEIKREVDTAGRERVVYRMSDPIIKKIEDRSKIDSISRELNIEKNKVKSIDNIRASLKAENLELKHIISEGLKDTSKWEYRDKWLVNTIYKIDTSYRANVWVDASVNKVEYDYKKYWLLGSNESRAKIWFNSPYIKPESFEYYRIKQKEPFLDLNLLIEGKYIHSQKELLIGPKIKLELGRLGISGGYYLNPGGSLGNGVWYGADWKVY